MPPKAARIAAAIFFRGVRRFRPSDGAIEAALRDQLRRRAGKKKAPTAAVVDSQSVKMVDQATGMLEAHLRHALAGPATRLVDPDDRGVLEPRRQSDFALEPRAQLGTVCA